MVSAPPPVSDVPAGQVAVAVAKPEGPWGPETVERATWDAAGPPVAHSAQAVVVFGPLPDPDSSHAVHDCAETPALATGCPEASLGKLPSRCTVTSAAEGATSAPPEMRTDC